MIEQTAGYLRPLLALPMVRRTRRNHGLEHATIHVLSSRIRDLRMAGRSDGGGFVLLGDAPTEMIESAVHDALRRMQNGEHHLAVHPNCGTNLVTTGFLATFAAMFGFAGASRRGAWDRMPAVTLGVMATILLSQPLGAALQKFITTDGDPADLEVLSITRDQVRTPLSRGLMTVHRVSTRST
jgi:hypothetical protein